MSAALPPKELSPNNPITDSSVRETLEPLGLSVPEKEEKHYTTFLKGIWEIWDRVEQMDDYVPIVDEERFPRENVHRPTGKDNPANAWAWKATIRDQQKNEGLLKGKTVALKVRGGRLVDGTWSSSGSRAAESCSRRELTSGQRRCGRCPRACRHQRSQGLGTERRC